MAEVRKKVVEDTYNTSSIKVKEKNKKEKKEEKKVPKKKDSSKEEKQNLFVRFRMFCSGVKSEFLKVKFKTICKIKALIYSIQYVKLHFKTNIT